MAVSLVARVYITKESDACGIIYFRVAQLVIYYRLFYAMKDENLLSVDDDIHLFCLHYVFVPRINAAIKEFTESWNDHSLSSEHNMSPVQLWTAVLSTLLVMRCIGAH